MTRIGIATKLNRLIMCLIPNELNMGNIILLVIIEAITIPMGYHHS